MPFDNPSKTWIAKFALPREGVPVACCSVSTLPHRRGKVTAMRHATARRILAVCFATGASACVSTPPTLERIEVSADGTHLIEAGSGEPFVVWGVNYDHDDAGRLIEDYWHDEWDTVVEDFGEIRALGANVVRIHLQLGRFMKSPTEVAESELVQLGHLLRLAEVNDLRLDLTGLGCYHARDVPPWYDRLSEVERWAVQSRFWEAVAAVCRSSSALFCYDLMNEPILPGATPETDWLAGEFAGKHFVQRIALDLAGRSREQVAQAWVERLVGAIRRHDPHHLITVGVIPWALTFPGAKPIFYAPSLAAHLDFVAIHLYPASGQLDAALTALRVYAVGKPLVVEETFPLRCSPDELVEFMERAAPVVAGWMSFYWGKPAAVLELEDSLTSRLVAAWLRRFEREGTTRR